MSSDLKELADELDAIARRGNPARLELHEVETVAFALRILASQAKQEPVAWGRVIGGKAITISRERTPANDTPLYTSAPPPAAGWDEALRSLMKAGKIMAVCELCSSSYPEGCGHYDLDDLRETPDGAWVCENCWDSSGDNPIWEDLSHVESLRATPAATKPADAGVRVKPPLGKFAQWVEREKDGKTITLWMRTASGTHFRYSVLIDSGYGDVFGELEAALSHQPAPVAANASAEARLRDVISDAVTTLDQMCDGSNWPDTAQRGEGFHAYTDACEIAETLADELREALSPAPHASDCARETEDDEWALRLSGDETTKSDETGIRVEDNHRSHGASLQQGPDTSSNPSTVATLHGKGSGAANVANPVSTSDRASHVAPVSSDPHASAEARMREAKLTSEELLAYISDQRRRYQTVILKPDQIDMLLAAIWAERTLRIEATREAYRTGWYINAAEAGDGEDQHPADYLARCEEVDWQEYSKALSHALASDCEKQGAAQDAAVHGMGAIKDGEHVPVSDIYDLRPAHCRFRLQEEGKPYPRSSCTACGKNIATGLGASCKITPSDRPADVTVDELAKYIEFRQPYPADAAPSLARALLNAFSVGRR